MKIFLKLILVFFIFLSFCELFSYLFFPQFRENLIFFKKEEPYIKVSKGINQYFNRLDDLIVRVENYKDPVEIKEINSIWFLGDSVTEGYGEKFQDTYYNVLSKLLKENNKEYNIIPISAYGYSTFDLSNVLKKIQKYIKPNDIVIYQFNYNDIIEVNRSDINFELQKKNTNNWIRTLIYKTGKFRYRYLNHSVFLKVLQHHAGIISRKTNGNCQDRNKDALGPFYTYSFFAEGYESKSNELWKNFKNTIIEMNNITESLKASFSILVVPISLQLKFHQETNKLNYDLNCSTKNPHKHLLKTFNEENINYIDPLQNFMNYDQKNYNLFHLYDTNHPNKMGHKILGKSIYEKFSAQLESLKSNGK